MQILRLESTRVLAGLPLEFATHNPFLTDVAGIALRQNGLRRVARVGFRQTMACVRVPDHLGLEKGEKKRYTSVACQANRIAFRVRSFLLASSGSLFSPYLIVVHPRLITAHSVTPYDLHRTLRTSCIKAHIVGHYLLSFSVSEHLDHTVSN